MNLKKMFLIVLLVLFAVSCGDGVTTQKTSDSDDRDSDDSSMVTSDSDTVSNNDDKNSPDESEKNDNDSFVIPDDNEQNDEHISDTCGNGTIESPEVCDGGTKDCVEINDTKYSSGKAACRSNCSGWDTATCTKISPDTCDNGERRCYGAYQYQICSDESWGDVADCGDGATCYGEGRCSNECYPHEYYECSNGHVYWYDSCRDREEMKESCGEDGYVGSKYCQDDAIYQNYKTVYCDYDSDSCGYGTEEKYIEYCDNGCVSGVCNAEELDPPSNVKASDGNYDLSVHITWNSVSGATDYYIYRATSSTGDYDYVGSSEGDTDYYDFPPVKYEYYYYKISAYNSTSGESALSDYARGYCN